MSHGLSGFQAGVSCDRAGARNVSLCLWWELRDLSDNSPPPLSVTGTWWYVLNAQSWEETMCSHWQGRYCWNILNPQYIPGKPNCLFIYSEAEVVQEQLTDCIPGVSLFLTEVLTTALITIKLLLFYPSWSSFQDLTEGTRRRRERSNGCHPSLSLQHNRCWCVEGVLSESEVATRWFDEVW